MNRDDVIRMMREAGAAQLDLLPTTYSGFVYVFEHFAALVAAGEREACAQLCDIRMQQSRNHLVRSGLHVAALDIRARGNP